MSAKRFAATLVLVTVAWSVPTLAQDYGPYGAGGGGSSWGGGGSYGTFDWDGFYSGVYGGGVPLGDETSVNFGVFTGVNVDLSGIVVGAEAQLGLDWGDSMGRDALVVGRGGLTLGDALVYGTAGAGWVGGGAGYAVGGGAEYGFTSYLSGRVEVLGTGQWGEGLSDMRVTGGLAFHM